ncbi:MAG: hypothetical protein ACYSWO_24950 [Planctomycetota bacterium]|jgi:hypothetical protein
MRLPTANMVCDDVENRLILLDRFFNLKEDLTDEEWDKLVFNQRNPSARSSFVEAMKEIRSESRSPEDFSDLSPQAEWLVHVYRGCHLSSQMARQGSTLHNRIMDELADPYSALDQIDGLRIDLDDLKQRLSRFKPELVDNIAVDEALEQLGRAMEPNE